MSPAACLFDALRRAADRGVRVRLLLDDNNTAGMDPVLAELSSHRNIDVRLFNPFWSRRWRLLGYLTDFSRLNRRMHNKSFTADDQVTIIGGRNVGDEYFGAGDEVQFVDLDVMAIGDVVHEVTQDFNRYWSYASARPIERLLRTGGGTTRQVHPDAAHTKKQAERFLEAASGDPFVREMLEGRLSFEWANVCMVSDDPSKVRGRVRDAELLWTRLKRIVKEPAEELELVSAYFVPGKQGVDHFAEFARGGVRVTVLTNALEATDVAAVHAGYAKRREASARGRHHPVRAQTDGRAEHTEASWPRRQLRFQPSRQNVRDRPLGGVRRLVQLRPALDSAQHGAGVRDRQPGARDGAGRSGHRTARRPIVSSASGSRRPAPMGGAGRRQGGRARDGSPEPACGGD